MTTQYINILGKTDKLGVFRNNRTSIPDKFLPSAYQCYDLSDGYIPILSTKKMAYKSAFAETIGFIRGFTNASQFRELGCKFWDSDANGNKKWLSSTFRKGEDDLGCIYGSTWRHRDTHIRLESTDFPNIRSLKDKGYKLDRLQNNGVLLSKATDQLFNVINDIKYNSGSRRIIIHAWFPELFDQMALPPCHVLYKFTVDHVHGILHMSMYQRSCDLFLGIPMNMIGASLLHHLISAVCCLKPGEFSHHMSDVHIYRNAEPAVEEQLTRISEDVDLPKLDIKLLLSNKPVDKKFSTFDSIKWLESIVPSDLVVRNYNPMGSLIGIRMAQES